MYLMLVLYFLTLYFQEVARNTGYVRRLQRGIKGVMKHSKGILIISNSCTREYVLECHVVVMASKKKVLCVCNLAKKFDIDTLVRLLQILVTVIAKCAFENHYSNKEKRFKIWNLVWLLKARNKNILLLQPIIRTGAISFVSIEAIYDTTIILLLWEDLKEFHTI